MAESASVEGAGLGLPISLSFFILADLFCPLLHAQEIHIKVLDGRNGRAVTKECVNIWVGPARGTSLVIPTDKDGIASIRLAEKDADESLRRHGSACNGAAVIEAVVNYSDTIKITGDYYMPCQPHPPDSPFLSFSVKKVVQSGDASENHCGRIEVSPKPGELVFFVRPLHWWEKLKR